MILFNRIQNLLTRILTLLFLDKEIRDFIRHNHNIWGKVDIEHAAEAEVLFEYNTAHSSIISFSYLAYVLKRKFNARIVVYSINNNSRLSLAEVILRNAFEIILPSAEKKIFTSFGVDSFITIAPSPAHKIRAVQLAGEILPTLQNKRDVENLNIDGVWIGDLIYDTYLRRFSVPTIDITDEKFVYFICESLEIFVFWQGYFETHDVKAVNVTHCVYNNAMPLRIAVQKNIAAYQTNATHVYRMSERDIFAYGDYKYFPEVFSKLSPQEQVAGKREAQDRIELRFSGVVGVDMSYSTKSAYGEKLNQAVLRPSDKFKVLVAAHCFFDSPHSYGNNLFPDFYEWFDFLGQMSNETDYDWYIKTHPDFLPGNMAVIGNFLEKYPKFTLIDAKTSHHQLVDEGIGCALTTYGTIGFEYAALGIPVVNASLCNPHIAYNFNLHPQSVEEYGEIIRQLDVLLLKINKEEVYEYYYMKFIHNTENWLFENYQEMISQLGGYGGQFSPSVYNYFLRQFTTARHLENLSVLSRFVNSGAFRLNSEHVRPVQAVHSVDEKFA